MTYWKEACVILLMSGCLKNNTPLEKTTASFFLVGPMGCGKTMVGEIFADKLQYRFYDSDAEIEKKLGMDIATIFEREGEASFRRYEEQVLEYLTGDERIVLATGGGAVLSQQNRDFMSSRGIVIYLNASVETQLKHVAGSIELRPLLRQGDPAIKLAKLYAERKSLYEQIADIIVVVDNLSAELVADEILSKLNTTLKSQCPN